jgi:Histidine kinase-, DNA gyrase B-, and HSP90-like ATPase
VDVDQSDPTKSSLLFTSTHAFEPSFADAWWVAYDAIAVLDAEIRASNNLLLSRVQKDSSSPPFKMQRVTGADSPAELRKSIETESWIPTSAKIHVGNMQRLVETLGGQNLYGAGDNFAVVMRELIQNARDAVAARRSIASEPFVGRVLVKVSSKSNSQTFVEIRDDGVGMSERTMTGALLDFGTSFWTSDLVRSEFPGLRSSSFRPVGRFGIGFYAVFMVASEVLVASRRYDEGLSDVTRLHFANGLTLRPILAKGPDENYEVMSSTSVRLTIDQPIDRVINRVMNEGQPEYEWRIPLQSYLATITAALDVQVALQMEGEIPVTVHENIHNLNTPERVLRWIKDITFVEVPIAKGGADVYVSENAERMRAIEHDGHLLGLAALLDIQGVGFQFLTTDTIGGLTNQITRGAAGYMGYMESYAITAKRDGAKRVAPIEILQAWADQQVFILKERNANTEQLYWAASSMSNMELDPIDVILFPLILQSNQIVLATFEQTYNTLQQTPIACIRSRRTDFAEINIPPVVVDGLPTLRPLSSGNLIRLALENGRPKYPLSLLGCLDRLVLRQGRELTYEVKPTPMQTIFGPMDALIIRLKNA